MDFDKLAEEIFDIKMKVIRSGEICDLMQKETKNEDI